ncbi:SOS response-associated peptidase [Nocardioides zeae]|uniref:Abasic site processing protein n=1 Tax=Nocardioides imazamoxiresistens TaxID=3231893 RepID=A0ABU3PX33_9ACTN|nr:SOS response-associated peptidase [Nocardioides zeae]MDT9593714.1 SOS response-associated peptidase [Nocardioides zeae]
MCGRYASSREPDDLVDEFGVAETVLAEPLAPSWNVAPTDAVYAVLERPAKPEEGIDGPRRQLRALRWGLVPSWSKDAKIGSRLINARMETVAEKPSFRRAFAARRCLLPADGYYEWYVTEQTDAKGKPVKQPYFIRPDDGGTLAMAGLYEIWRDPDRGDDDPDRFRWTCTVITTEATDDLGRIHDRMPLMVGPGVRDDWLDPTASGHELLDLLEPAVPGRLTAYPVSTAVSNVRNDGAHLVDPLPLEEG